MDEIMAESGWRSMASAPEQNASSKPENGEPSGFFRSVLRSAPSAFGLLGATLGLVWVLHDFQFAQLQRLAACLDWRWLALALVFDVLSYVCQGWRWRLLLAPLGRTTTRRTTQAVYAGLFTNEILPLRLGELVRTYLVAHWLNVRFVAILPTLVVERLFDALWLVTGIGVTAALLPLPPALLRTADVVGLGVIVLAVVLGYGVARTPRWAATWLTKLGDGWLRSGRTRAFYQSLGISLLLLICQALAYWLVMWGCGLRYSFWIGAAVYLIVHLGTAVPNAPANVGAYQFFTVVGLALFGVDKATATAFSLVVFTVLTLPLLLLGFAAISTSGTSLGQLRRAAQRSAHVR